MSTVAQSTQDVLDFDPAGNTALAALPKEWIGPVGFFCLAKIHLMRTRGCLVANLTYWREKCGLTLDDLRPILQDLCRPDVTAQHLFENQLMVELSSRVDRVLRRKRILIEMAMRREAAAEPWGPESVVVSLANFTKRNCEAHGIV